MSNKDALYFKKALLDGKVVSFPTETVMGLGVIYDDYQAYNLLNQIKRRPEDKPYTLMLGDKKDIEKYAYLTERERKIIDKFVPGPITLLLKAKEIVPGFVTHNTGIIGLPTNNWIINSFIDIFLLKLLDLNKIYNKLFNIQINKG